MTVEAVVSLLLRATFYSPGARKSVGVFQILSQLIRAECSLFLFPETRDARVKLEKRKAEPS